MNYYEINQIDEEVNARELERQLWDELSHKYALQYAAEQNLTILDEDSDPDAEGDYFQFYVNESKTEYLSTQQPWDEEGENLPVVIVTHYWMSEREGFPNALHSKAYDI